MNTEPTTEPAGRGDLAGKTALVTGGSRGIGAATVRLLAADGAHVILHYGRNREAAQEVAEALGPEHVSLVQEDLSSPRSAEKLWNTALATAGSIDVLVNNAGAWLASPTEDAEEWHRGWEENLQLNLQSPADLCRLAVRDFAEAGGGVIVNVTSRSAHRGDDAEHLAYGAAKAGLAAVTKSIARFMGRSGVLAYAVSPGWVATDLAEGQADGAGLPLGEVTPPEDVAEVIRFLASGRARHATGSTIDITGADYVR